MYYFFIFKLLKNIHPANSTGLGIVMLGVVGLVIHYTILHGIKYNILEWKSKFILKGSS